MLWKESQKSKPQYVIPGLTLLILAGIGFAVFKKRMWSLADDIVDSGDYLLGPGDGAAGLVRDRKHRHPIPISASLVSLWTADSGPLAALTFGPRRVRVGGVSDGEKARQWGG
jgi:hypothetical protein